MKLHKNFAFFVAMLANIIGIADTIYLSVKYYNQTPLSCTILSDCNIVLESEYSIFWGVPLSLWGVMFYLFIFTMLISNKIKIIKQVTLIGFIASLWFLYIQIFIIQAVCIYCLVSTITTLTLFMSSLHLKTAS